MVSRLYGWAANILFIASMLLLGSGSPLCGWLCSFFANALYAVRCWQWRDGDWELFTISAICMALAAYNAYEVF